MIDYDAGPVAPSEPRKTERRHVSRLVACDKFVLDHWDFETPQTVGGDDRFHILAVLEGVMRISGDPTDEPLTKGQTLLLPAAAAERELVASPKAVMLDMYLP